MKKDIINLNGPVDSNAYVLTASCGCLAGAGPTFMHVRASEIEPTMKEETGMTSSG